MSANIPKTLSPSPIDRYSQSPEFEAGKSFPQNPETRSKSSSPPKSGNFIITFTPTNKNIEAQKAAFNRTSKFRNSIQNGGFINLDVKDIESLKAKRLIPVETNSAEITIALHAYSLGGNGEELMKLSETAPFLQGPARDSLLRISYIMSALKESGIANIPSQETISLANGNPRMSIQEIDYTPKYQHNQLALQFNGNSMNPIVSEVVGRVGDFAKDKIKDFAVKAIKKGGEKLVKKGAEIVAKTGLKTTIEAAAQGLNVVPGLGLAVAALIEIGEKLLSKFKIALTKLKKWISEHKDDVAGFALALLGVGLLTGSELFLGLGAGLFLGLVAVGGSTLVLSGIGGVTSTVFAFLIALTPAGRVAAYVFWIIAGFILLTIVTVFVINTGGYVVPYWQYEDPYNNYAYGKISTDNPYIGVSKVANPSKVDNPTSTTPRVITYTVTITAKNGSLSNIRVTGYTCTVSKKDKSKVNCPPVTLPPIPTGTPIIVGSAYSFSYTVSYDTKYIDSLVTDTITITADSTTKPNVSSSSTASVCIGDCPNNCFIFDDSWGSRLGEITQVLNYLISNFSPYMQKVCSAYPNGILVTYGGSNGNFWGWFSGQPRATMHVYEKGMTSDPSIYDTVYIFAHEAAHALANGMPSIFQEYTSWPGVGSEIPKCFYDYSYVGWDPSERFAEAISYYTIGPWSKCSGWETRYPAHFSFVDQKIFR